MNYSAKHFKVFLNLLLFFILLLPFNSIHAADKVSIKLGPEQVVYDSTIDYIPDQGYYIYKWGGDIFGVIGGSGSGIYSPVDKHSNYLVTGNPLRETITTDSLTEMTGLGPGKKGRFDEQGRWLASVWADADGVLHGFYHAEIAWEPSLIGNKNRNSTGYAVSTDGGKNWTKPDYPNNQIIKGFRLYGSDPHLLVTQDYLYMFYSESITDSPGSKSEIALARSPIADKGKPGSWLKYYCKTKKHCGFTESGLGGNYTPINIADPPGALFVTYNKFLDAYLAIGNDAFWKGDSLTFYESTDLINWTLLATASIDNPQKNWGRIYAGIVSEDEKSSEVTGKEFWFYYVTRQQNGTKRYLNRRKVSMKKKSVDNSPTSTITITNSPTPANNNLLQGDANEDGKVDGLDYLIWLNHYGTTTTRGSEDGDYNTLPDGKVDGIDYVIMVSNYK